MITKLLKIPQDSKGFQQNEVLKRYLTWAIVENYDLNSKQ